MKNYLKAFLAVGAFLFASVGLAADGLDPDTNSETFEELTMGPLTGVKMWTTNETTKTIIHNGIWESEEAVDESMGDLAVVTNSTSGGTKYLALETGKPLYRNISTAGGVVPYAINSGLYFEGDVQFTPYEEDVALVDDKGNSTLDSGTKLLVYIKGTETTTDENNNEVKGTTNFVVVAGYYDDDDGITEKRYECSVPDGFDYDKYAWHHLLIKAYLTKNGTYSYFKVFVDNKALTHEGESGDPKSSMYGIGSDAFPSMDKSIAPTTLEGIGFQGTGAIDNVLWTTVDPDPTEIKVAYVWSNGTFKLKVNGKDKEVVSGDPYEFSETDERVVTFEPAAGYLFDATTDVTETTKDGVTTYTYTPQKAGAVVTIEGEDTYVKDFASAVALANDKKTATTVKLLADATMGEDSIIFGDMESEPQTGYDVVLILNEHTLKVPGGLAAVAKLTIVDKSQETVTDTGSIVTKNDKGTPGTIYAATVTVYGGKFDTLPTVTGTVTVPEGYELTSEADSDGWYRLKKSGSSTDEPTIDGGDDNTKVDPETKTITVESSEFGEITITGDASEYTISVPQNVTTITGTVNKDKITIMGKSEGMTTAVDITGAFSVTTVDNNVTTIALDPDGKVTVNGVEVSVTPELDTTEGAEPFAVGDSVSATVKAIPGLTYSLLSSTDVSTVKTSTTSECDKTADASGTVTLEDKNTDKPAAKFYVIKVSR